MEEILSNQLVDEIPAIPDCRCLRSQSKNSFQEMNAWEITADFCLSQGFELNGKKKKEEEKQNKITFRSTQKTQFTTEPVFPNLGHLSAFLLSGFPF